MVLDLVVPLLLKFYFIFSPDILILILIVILILILIVILIVILD